jgi:SWI/SNF-related matrix-associated actin-dependent regulator of chromatin subfamily A3
LENVDIVITTYNTLVSEYKRHAAEPQLVYSVHWRRVVLDEGKRVLYPFAPISLTVQAHDIRESYRIRARATFALEATNRWALTGTPIQNGLSDLASLYKFIRAFPYNETRHFTTDISQLCRSTDGDDAIEKLKKLVTCVTLRRSIAIIDLPSKSNLISKLTFSPEESALYEEARSTTKRLLEDAIDRSSGTIHQVNVLPWINCLRMICNLGTRAKIPQSSPTDQLWDSNAAQDTFNSLVVAGTAMCSNCQTDLGTVATEVADDVSKVLCQSYLCSCLHLICGPCVEKGSEDLTHCGHEEPHPPMPVSTLSSTLPIDENVCTDTGTLPTKVGALLQDLDQHYRTEKCVVFSYWTSTLDIIEEELRRKAIQSVRFDGNTRNKARVKVIQDFHQVDSVRVALMSLSCGSVGLDLTAASRAYLMEPHWNPSVEQQALARVYRMGQRRPVTTVRYIMRNSFEDVSRMDFIVPGANLLVLTLST